MTQLQRIADTDEHDLQLPKLEEAEHFLNQLPVHKAANEVLSYLQSSCDEDVASAAASFCLQQSVESLIDAHVLDEILQRAATVCAPRDLHMQLLGAISALLSFDDGQMQHDRLRIHCNALGTLIPRLDQRKQPWAFVHSSESLILRCVDRIM